MDNERLIELYFNWLCDLVCTDMKGDNYYKHLYSNLLCDLFDCEFTYILPMDENRCSDGKVLRYRYSCTHGLSPNTVGDILSNKPCSVLEMMVALSIKCEDIMMDPAYGDRTGVWFWEMIFNLDLGDMDNDHYDPTFVNLQISDFLSRNYSRSGKGNIFSPKTNKDIRLIEIWTQALWHLNEVIANE